jgi:plasmid replication initiation protein
MLINIMQKRWESTKKLDKLDYDFIASGVISFDDYRNTMQIASKDNKELILAIKELFNFTLCIEDNNVLKFMHLFTHFDVDKSKCLIKFKFSERFLEYFTGICRDYFQLSIEEVIGLNSTHAIRIYQLLKTKQNMDKKEFIYTLDEIKKQLNIDKKYKLYGHLKSAVLELAKTQINSSEASHFNIDYEEIKTGKAVTSIKFHILPKGKNYYQENNLIAGYKLDQIAKYCNNWKKEYSKNDVVYILSEKILAELKNKKHSRAAIANWLDTIATITKQQKLFYF